jgi:pimeloyl-ACP methyl ester carboxylesterase
MLSSLLRPIFLASLAHAYVCTNFIVPVTITAPSYIPNFKEFGTHYDAVQFLVGLTTRPTEGTRSPFSGSQNATADFAIGGSFCNTNGDYDKRQDVQILSHGLGFDRSYWSFGGGDSEYNYVRAATNAGYATMAWSRPGTGLSSSGNAYSILQTEIQAAVLVELTKLLRSGSLHADIPKPIGRVLHVGHSFGSALSNILIAKNPELSDGVVLTGMSHNLTVGTQFPASTNFHLAKENQPERFGNLSTGIITWADELALQYNFFKHPYFDPAVLAYAEAQKWPFGKSIRRLIVQWSKY